MPTLDLDENNAMYQIRSFQTGILKVNDKTLTQSAIVTPNQLIENWAPQTVAELTAHALSPITELKPDILLIGTGSVLVFIPIEIYGELINQGIGVEVMDSSAACRTYNALSAENRRVAAAIIIR